VRIAYLTTDEVNEDLALRLADKCDATLYSVGLRGAPPDGEVDVVLFDWDHLPEDHREKVLARLLKGRRSSALALHSYNLEEAQVQALRKRGVAVFHRLNRRLFRRLGLCATKGEDQQLATSTAPRGTQPREW
jgi:hypothetical protein